VDNTIVNQVDVDIAELLSFSNTATVQKKSPDFEVKLTSASPTYTKNNNKVALLQISIACNPRQQGLLEKSLSMLEREFKSVTIFIDMRIALLAYSIILPHMSNQQLEDIAEEEKARWTDKNIAAINSIKASWSIATDKEQSTQQAINENILKLNELLKTDKVFNQKIKDDAIALKKHLIETHGITEVMYDQYKHKNNIAVEQYLIARIAGISALSSFHDIKYTYITQAETSSYDHLKKIEAIHNLPNKLSICFTKHTTENLATSTELNQNLHKFDLLGTISAQKSYLEHSAKHFPGFVYVQSLNRTLLASNKAHSLAFGVAEESYLTGKSFEDLLSQDGADKVAEIVQEITTTNKAKILIEKYVFLGESCTFLSIKTPLRNKKDKNIGVIGFTIKLKDKKHIEELKDVAPENIIQAVIANNETSDQKPHALENKQYSNKTIVELKEMIKHMPGHVFWQDTDGKILGCNYNHAKFLGLDSPTEAIGQYPTSFLTARHAIEAITELAEIIRTGEPIIKEEIYKSASNLVVMSSHKTAIKDNNNIIIGVMVVALDLSKNKQQQMKLEQEKEKLEIANNFKSRFIKDIEDDMRTPFVQLCDMTKSCAGKENDLAKKRQLLEISNCAKDLLAYCDSLLEFSKKESFKNNKNLISLKDLANSIVNTSISAIRAKGLEFELDYDNSIPESIIGDSYRLKRILSNLMSNAIKYTEQGYIKMAIKLETGKETGADNAVTISFVIMDSGIGISKDDQENIFNKYKMLNHMPHISNAGQGLGLSEIGRFVEDLRGDIIIDSDINKGTSVIVKLNFELDPITA
jgi:two-component system, OmpR family, aerobic respiration control sensor histidine kinase ArcB